MPADAKALRWVPSLVEEVIEPELARLGTENLALSLQH